MRGFVGVQSLLLLIYLKEISFQYIVPFVFMFIFELFYYIEQIFMYFWCIKFDPGRNLKIGIIKNKNKRVKYKMSRYQMNMEVIVVEDF